MDFFSVQAMLGKMEPQGELESGRQIAQKTLRIAWPAMVESFMVSVVAIIDTMMVGSLGSVAIAAVGLTTQPKFIALSFFISLNVAVSAMVARRLGEGNRKDANSVLIFCVGLTVLMTALISVVFVGFSHQIIGLMQGEPDTTALAIEYITIIIGGIGFTTISLVINAAQRGAGNTKIAMRTNLVSNGINVVLNYLLIGGNFGFPALGIRGAAIATVIGSAVACVMSLLSVSKRSGFLYLWDFGAVKLQKHSLAGLWKIGYSSFFEQVFQRIGFLLYAVTVSSLGTAVFAAHQIGINICMLSFSLGEGLGYAAVSMVGRSLGEKRLDMAKIYGEACQRIGLMCSGAMAVVFLLGGRFLFGLFTQEAEVLGYAAIISFVLCYVTFVQISAVVYAGALRGAGDTFFIAAVSLVSVAIIRPLGSWILCYPLGLGLAGAWFGFAFDVTVRFVLTFLRFRSGRWTQIKV